MRRLLRGAAAAAGLALAAGVTAGAVAPAQAAGSCDVTFGAYRTVSKYSTGAQARGAECLLSNDGFGANVNGRFWDADTSATKKFQRAVGMSSTGTVGKGTWTALLSQGTTPLLKRGDHGAAVRRLQRSLIAAGHDVGVNGGYGGRTENAVKTYQRYVGLKATGNANDATWHRLQQGRLGSKPAVSSATKGERALAFARAQLGDSYSYGATGPNSWDCSGLTGGAWKSVGVTLPRTSQGQFHAGKAVAKSDLRKGDLVFFYSGISHVAIYAGNGKVIHASQPGRPVSYIKMKYMPYAGARRPA